MHVCLLSLEWPPYGCGIGSYMFNLARGLVSAGHRVTVITHDRNPVACSGASIVSVALPDCRRTLLCRVKRGLRRVLAGVRHPWSWEAWKTFQQVRQAEPVDVVETAEFGAWGWHFMKDAHVPVVVRCHTAAHILWSASQSLSHSGAMPASLRKQDRLEREQTQSAEGIASPSQALACHLSLAWVIPLNRFVVIPNPIDAELFRPGDGSAARTEILYVGRLEYNKGVFDLAESLVPVLEEHPGVSVRFVGMNLAAPPGLSCKGKTACDVIRSVVPGRFGDRLLFTSHVPVTEIIRLQQKALLAVVPTRGFESFSYTVLEAMACGTPVIATRCGGPGEIITDEVDGLLVPPGRPAALTEAMRRLLADPLLRRRLGTCGRQTVEARFSMPAVLPKIVDWYSDVIRGFKESRRAGTARE
ncbi:MAG TPA: glycosyltransferase family 4 protein [Sedimentisphaerales bacterium]|nr:glycosyltransferase family 4 protein [Sedimentisphaerales bacterium]